MHYPLLINFSMKVTVKRCVILYVIIGLSVSLIACGGDETPEESVLAQTPQETRDTAINVEEMVLIPAGEVKLGTDNKTDLTFGTETDTRTVFVAAFYMDRYEVTNKQYAKFLTETGHRKPKFWEDPRLNAPDQPVVGVNWEDAEIYAAWAGKRLPTASEWEKAARGTDGRLYPWGNDYDAATRQFRRRRQHGRQHRRLRNDSGTRREFYGRSESLRTARYGRKCLGMGSRTLGNNR